jgi:uncharacterized protein YcfL
MKRFIVLCAALSMVVLVGCKATPEKAAEKHFKKTVDAHSGITTENLKVTTLKADDKKAVVKVEASLKYAEELTLVNEDGKWVVK